VAGVEVFGDVLCNHGFVGFEQIKVTAAHRRGDLETDVKQLPEAGIVRCRVRIVAYGRGELFGGPGADLCRRREHCRVDIDHRRVGSAELGAVIIGFGVDFFASAKPPASASPMISSNHVVPAVLRCTPVEKLFVAVWMAE